jgi:hypothetical protein
MKDFFRNSNDLATYDWPLMAKLFFLYWFLVFFFFASDPFAKYARGDD